MGDEFLPWENPNNCEVIYIHQEHDTVGVFEFGYDAAVSSWATIHVKQYPVDIWSDDNWSYKTKIIPLWELKSSKLLSLGKGNTDIVFLLFWVLE